MPEVKRPHPVFFIIFAFLLSTALTAAFILRYEHYASRPTMLLSAFIAGAKWAIQIGLGLFFLQEKRWIYITQLATTCLIGSVVLIPYAAFGGSPAFFFGSLCASIIIMIIDIKRRLHQIQLSNHWFSLWVILLALAVSLQLTVVFRLF